MPPPPSELPEEMQEEILLRFPPNDPARLVQAALVCKPWCRLISGAGFRRRYREFHRTPPLLGFFCNTVEAYNPYRSAYGPDSFRFVPTSSFTAPGVNSRKLWWWVTDGRHGRVLLHRTSEDGVSPMDVCQCLKVWDPTTGEEKELPSPAPELTHTNWWTAAVLCDADAGAGGGGACDHLDCHLEPFIVVFVASIVDEGTFISTYSSNAASWSMPIVPTEYSDDLVPELTHAAHLGISDEKMAIRGLQTSGRFILKYDLELCEMSWIEGPRTSTRWSYVALTATECGGLELAILHGLRSELYMWSRAPKAYAKWTRSRAIQLCRFDAALAYSPKVLGFAADIGVIFVKADWDDKICAIDLKTNELITKAKVAATRRSFCLVVPYCSFYTPALEVATIGGERDVQPGAEPSGGKTRLSPPLSDKTLLIETVTLQECQPVASLHLQGGTKSG